VKYNKLKNCDVEISSIGLGTWVFGGDMFGAAEEKECINAVCAAVDNGINLIDTAPIYGYGRSEEIVGKAIKGKRDKVFIATKCGLVGKGKDITNDLSKESITKELEDSLRRLDIDCIDLYQCHWPDDNTPIEETMDVLNKFKDEGKIKYIGVSNFGKEILAKASELAEIVTLQSQYSMLERAIEDEILPCAIDNGIGFMAYGPLAGGILSGKYKAAPEYKGADARSFFYQYYSKNAFEKVNEMLQKLLEFDKLLYQVAINWIRQQKGVATVLTGCRNSEQVEKNASSASWDLSLDEISAIDKIIGK